MRLINKNKRAKVEVEVEITNSFYIQEMICFKH